MKKIIRLTESDLHNILSESVKAILEDLGGTSSFSVNSQTGSQSDPTGQQKNNIDVPFGKVQRRKIYSPKGDAKGDVTKQESNVDMSPALKRKNGKGGSISIPKRGVNESIDSIDSVEGSPLWVNIYGDYEKDIAHKRKVYYYLCKIFDEIMDNLKGAGLEPSVAFKSLMPLQNEIKSHEEY